MHGRLPRGTDLPAAGRERNRPLLTAPERFPRGKLALLSQKSTLAVAIRYATSRWDGLTLYADDGRMEHRQRKRFD